MNEKQIAMVRTLLRSSKPVSGKQIAGILGVSTRTVINYMNELNGLYPEPVILSTPSGYLIDRERSVSLADQVSRIPDGYRERVFYLCKRLLLESERQLDVFELSDEMCVSYSLLKSDLQKMNQSFAYLNIKFAVKNNQVAIIGKEADKRRLMNHMLSQAQEMSLLDIACLKQYFPEQMVVDILELLEENYRASGYYLNDFSRINILLHILIIVTRILNGNSLESEPEKGKRLELDASKDGDYGVANTLCRCLSECFGIRIGSGDRLQIALLIKSNASPMGEKTEETLLAYVGKEMLDGIRTIIRETEDKFCIRLNSRDFFARFALHVRSMHARSKNHTRLINPLKASLSGSSPFLFDIAMEIAQRLEEMGIVGGPLAEDEISFIVLHIGAEIERQNMEEHKISCVLMMPEYLDIGSTIVQKLLGRFGEQILIRQIVTLKDSGDSEDCDLIVSVMERNVTMRGQAVYISPFLTSSDYNSINDAIEQVWMRRSMEYLRKNFDFYFSEKNFVIDRSMKLNQDKVIRDLCGVLIRNGYVTDDYRENVFKREAASPTAYFDFAIPHSVCMEAKVNAIGVMIAPNGIRWNEHIVYVVFLMAIAPDSLADFQTLYSTLAQILTDTGIIKVIRNGVSFHEFKKRILNPWL